MDIFRTAEAMPHYGAWLPVSANNTGYIIRASLTYKSIGTMKNHTVKKAAPVVKQESGMVTTAHDFNSADQSNEDAVNMINYSRTEFGIENIARNYLQWGLCPIPTVKGEKRPVGNWKEYQDRLPTEAEWEQWETEELTAFGVVCGRISGNLLVIDFDKQGEAFAGFKTKVPVILWRRLVIEHSPSGGYHIYVRSEQPVSGNKVLARDDDGEILIETRGEGGFIVCAPSPGYTLIQGDFNNIPVLQPEKVELLLNAARRFDRKPKPETVTPKSLPSPRPVTIKVDDPLPPGDWHGFGELKQYLMDAKRVFEFTATLCGLNEGKRSGDPEHHQPCPIPHCESDDDGFFYRPKEGTTHCRVCGHNGDIFSLVGEVHGLSPIESYEMVAAAVRKAQGLAATSGIFESSGENYGNNRNGNYGNAGNSEIGVGDKNSGNYGNGNYGNGDNESMTTNVGNVKCGNTGNYGNGGNGENRQSRFEPDSVKLTEYVYTDEEGRPRHKVSRFDGVEIETGKPGKDVSQSKAVCGIWAQGAPDEKYPYRLPELLPDEIDALCIVEGEKTADKLNEVLQVAGFVNTAVTTSPGGSSQGSLWEEFVKRYPAIAEKTIRIFPDNDEPGRKYARTIVTAVLEANPDAEVMIVSLPDLPDGGDFVDWYSELAEQGHDETVIIGKFMEVCEQAELITADNVATWNLSEQGKVGPSKQWQPFPIETLPPLLQSYVTEVSRSIGIDTANSAASVLSIISGAIGRTFEIEIKSSHHEYAALWVALVAGSGEAKSPPIKFARKPLDMLEREARKEGKEEYDRYERELERYKKTQKGKGSDSGMYEKPVKPIIKRFITSDCTTEKLVTILSENPYGVSLIRDELAAFFGGMDAYRAAKMDRQNYIEIHGGHSICVDRQKDTMPIGADTPSISIIGGIQTEVLRRLFAKEPEFLSTGFGARFLMVYPPAEPICWNHNEPDQRALTAYEKLVEKIVYYREKYTPDDPGVVHLTDEARDMIFEFQNQKACESMGVSDGDVRYVLNKAGMQAARLCLVLHIAKCAETDLSPTAAVSEETMEQALTLTQWFLDESERVYAMLRSREPESLGDRDALLIMAKIKGLGGEATASKLKDGIRKYHCKGGMEALRKKLTEMVGSGKLTVRQKTEGRGPKTDIFCIPAVPIIPIPIIPEIPVPKRRIKEEWSPDGSPRKKTSLADNIIKMKPREEAAPTQPARKPPGGSTKKQPIKPVKKSAKDVKNEAGQKTPSDEQAPAIVDGETRSE